MGDCWLNTTFQWAVLIVVVLGSNIVPFTLCYHAHAAETSTITGPMALKSYYAVSSYKDKKSLFGFNEGDVVQLMQKDPSGWISIEHRVCMYVFPPYWEHEKAHTLV